MAGRPGSYGGLNAFPTTADSVNEWLDAIQLVRASGVEKKSGQQWPRDSREAHWPTRLSTVWASYRLFCLNCRFLKLRTLKV